MRVLKIPYLIIDDNVDDNWEKNYKNYKNYFSY